MRKHQVLTTRRTTRNILSLNYFCRMCQQLWSISTSSTEFRVRTLLDQLSRRLYLWSLWKIQSKLISSAQKRWLAWSHNESNQATLSWTEDLRKKSKASMMNMMMMSTGWEVERCAASLRSMPKLAKQGNTSALKMTAARYSLIRVRAAYLDLIYRVGSYRKHQMTHGERMYICKVPTCGKRFLDNSKLKRH